MFSIALRHEQHTRQYAVSASQPSGWELTLQEDLERVKRVHFEDWHRVERAVAVVRLEIEELTSRGWHVENSRGMLLES
jgi:tRNA A37 N6-isopentenylltransferase MiaA